MLTWIVKAPAFVLFFVSGSVFGESQNFATPPALQERISQVAKRGGSRIGVSPVHVESGRTIALSGDQSFPLYSVVKLPLAVAVLKDIEGGSVRLDQKISVSAEDVVAGSPGNTGRWEKAPMTVSVRELLEFALVNSDNTSCDKLLQLIGGPAI